MRGGPSPWLDDLDGEEDEPTRRGTTRPRIVLIAVLAGLPWLAVVALLVLPGRLGGVNGAPVGPERPAVGASESRGFGIEADADTTDAGKEPTSDSDEAATSTAQPPEDPRTGPAAGDRAEEAGAAEDASPSPTEPVLDLVELRGRWRPVPGPEEAASLAMVVARAWLTGIEPVLEIDGVPPVLPHGYAEHLIVEAVERPSPEAAVVTLLAVVLEGEPELRPRVRRLAVPIAWERDGPRPAGEPWWLPGPELEPRLPELQIVDDPDEQLLAVEALTRAGYREVELHELRGGRGWPLVADVDARTPAGDLVDGDVWLRQHQGRLVVAGTALSTSHPPPTTARHDEEPAPSAADPAFTQEVDE